MDITTPFSSSIPTPASITPPLLLLCTNAALTSIVVSIDPTSSGVTTPAPLGWFLSNPAKGGYTRPGANVQISNAEYADLVAAINANRVIKFWILLGNPTGPGKPSPVLQFGYEVNQAVQTLERHVQSLQKQVEALEREPHSDPRPYRRPDEMNSDLVPNSTPGRDAE